MRSAAASLVILFTVAGCQKADGLVVLTVTSASPLSSLTALHVSAVAGGRTVAFDDWPASPFTLPPSRTLGIQFPPSVAGPMTITVQAQSSSGVAGEGTMTVAAPAGARTDVTLTLGGEILPSGDLGDLSGTGDLSPVGDMSGAGDMAGCGFVTACVSHDNCCPAGCNRNSDSDCAAVCGNGVVEADEVCDDGNQANGDSCDPTCRYTNSVSVLAGVADGIGRADGTATDARLGGATTLYSQGITSDGTDIYFGDSCSIKKLTVKAPSTITTIAGGNGICATPVDDQGIKARFDQIGDLQFVANGGAGVIYISGDTDLRVLDLGTMQVTSIKTVAGNGGLNAPGCGLASDATNTTAASALYLIDQVNGLRRMALADNSVTTILAGGTALNCSDVVTYQGAYYAACGAGGVVKITPGSPATVTTIAQSASGTETCGTSVTPELARLGNPNRITVDEGGQLVISDNKCHVIWSLSPSSLYNPFVVAGNGNFVPGHADSLSGSGTIGLNKPMGTVFAPSIGLTYILDAGNRTIRRSDLAQDLATVGGVWGNDGSAAVVVGRAPQFSHPYGVQPLGDGTAFVLNVNFTDFSTVTYLLNYSDPSGVPSDVQFANGLAITGAILGGDLYTWNATDRDLWRYPLTSTLGARFAGVPNGSDLPSLDGSLDSAILNPGTLPVTDGKNLFFGDGTRIREIDLENSQVVTLAGADGSNDEVDGIGAAAHFGGPTALACDGPNLYIIDGGNNVSSSVIRKLEIATRTVTTLAGKVGVAGDVDDVGAAARFDFLGSIATDGKSLFVVQAGEGAFSTNFVTGDLSGPVVRQIELPSGRVTTMAGTRGVWTCRPGVGAAAAFNVPAGIRYDSFSRSLLLVDAGEDVILRIK